MCLAKSLLAGIYRDAKIHLLYSALNFLLFGFLVAIFHHFSIHPLRILITQKIVEKDRLIFV